MTLHYILDGVDLGNQVVRLGWGDGLVSRAEKGTIASASLPLDDPAGTLTTTGLSILAIQEDACSNPYLWAGYIADRDIARVPGTALITGAARRQTPMLVDLNGVFNLRVIRGNAAKRPAETVSARMAWLLASPWVYYTLDEGEVASGVTTQMSAADYRGQFAGNVLNDMAELTGYNYFAYINPATNHQCLYFRPPSYTGFASTLRFTNVLADVDSSTTFTAEGKLNTSPEDVFSGVYVRYSGGTVLVSRQSTVDAFFIRQTTIDKPNITTRAKAIEWGNRFLDDHDTEHDVLTIVCQLPKDKANLVVAGNRVEFKFSHLGPAYTSYTFARVISRTVAQDEETDDLYRVTLEIGEPLLTQGSGGTSADNTHVWPTNLVPFSGECGSDAPYVQGVYADASGSTSSTWTYGATPTSGNLLLALYQRATSNPDTHYNHETPTDTGWLDTGVYGTYLIDPTVNRIGGMRLWYKVAGAAETGITLTDPIDGGNINGGLILAEYGGVGSNPVLTVIESAIQYTSVNGVLPTLTANAPALLISMLGASLGAAHTPPTGYTERLTHISGDPWTLAFSDRFVSAAGTYGGENYVGPGIGPATWLLPLLAFEVDCNSPSTGQPIRNEQGRPGSPTTHPYAALSLDVHVDGVLQIVTESNPATGAYDIGWVPGPTATVRRDYLSE